MTHQLELVQGTPICFPALSRDYVYCKWALSEGCAGPRSLKICIQLESGRNEDQYMFLKE